MSTGWRGGGPGLEEISRIEIQAKQAKGGTINSGFFLTVLSLGVFGTMNAVLMVPALLVEIASDLDISVAIAGQLATATFAAWAVSVVTVGPLSDSFGRRPVAVAGLLLIAASVLGSAFAPNLELLLVCRVLTGLGAGTLPPNMVGAISDVLSPEKRARAVSTILAVGQLSSVVSVPVAAVLADVGSWRFSFMVAGLLSAGGFAVNWIWFPRDSRERLRDFVIFSRYWSVIIVNYFQVALTVNFAHRVVFWTMISFFAAYMIHTYDVSVGFVALPLAITAIGQVAGSYAGGIVAANRHRALLVAAACAAGGACGFLFFAVDLQLWVAVAVATAGTGVLSLVFPVLVAGSTEYSGESTATGVGLMGFTNQMGGVLGAAVAGGLLANSGYNGIAYLCLGASIISVLLAVVFARQLRIAGG